MSSLSTDPSEVPDVRQAFWSHLVNVAGTIDTNTVFQVQVTRRQLTEWSVFATVFSESGNVLTMAHLPVEFDLASESPTLIETSRRWEAPIRNLSSLGPKRSVAISDEESEAIQWLGDVWKSYERHRSFFPLRSPPPSLVRDSFFAEESFEPLRPLAKPLFKAFSRLDDSDILVFLPDSLLTDLSARALETSEWNAESIDSSLRCILWDRLDRTILGYPAHASLLPSSWISRKKLGSLFQKAYKASYLDTLDYAGYLATLSDSTFAEDQIPFHFGVLECAGTAHAPSPFSVSPKASRFLGSLSSWDWESLRSGKAINIGSLGRQSKHYFDQWVCAAPLVIQQNSPSPNNRVRSGLALTMSQLYEASLTLEEHPVETLRTTTPGASIGGFGLPYSYDMTLDFVRLHSKSDDLTAAISGMSPRPERRLFNRAEVKVSFPGGGTMTASAFKFDRTLPSD
jgi:hypothetical protein